MSIKSQLFTINIYSQDALWLKKYNKEVLTPPDETALARFDTGNEVGDLACELFPNGREVAYTSNFDEMIKQTIKYIDDGIKYIYEATFSYDGILVMIDVLEIHEDGVSIYEVKSSTSVKDIYVHDASIHLVFHLFQQM